MIVGTGTPLPMSSFLRAFMNSIAKFGLDTQASTSSLISCLKSDTCLVQTHELGICLRLRNDAMGSSQVINPGISR
jgi:hypothetical protein